MAKASQVMYLIGKIINIIEIVCAALLLLAGAICVSMPEEFIGKIDKITTAEEAKAFGVTIIVIAVIMLIVSIVVLALANKAKKAVAKGSKQNAPHIIMIVIGVIGGDIFYLLGGVFGLVAQNNAPQQQ